MRTKRPHNGATPEVACEQETNMCISRSPGAWLHGGSHLLALKLYDACKIGGRMMYFGMAGFPKQLSALSTFVIRQNI
jgi:hypothetical protein